MSVQRFRAATGGLVDRSRPLHFIFDGTPTGHIALDDVGFRARRKTGRGGTRTPDPLGVNQVL